MLSVRDTFTFVLHCHKYAFLDNCKIIRIFDVFLVPIKKAFTSVTIDSVIRAVKHI